MEDLQPQALCQETVSNARASTSEVGELPQDLSGALRQSQRDIEEEKTALARSLHDDLGGLLVGALMDIEWVAQQPGHPDMVATKLSRATALLRSAIAFKRILIENLRPTLLDNIGLFATLRWHMKAICEAARVAYVENYPDGEVNLAADTRIGVYRIVEQALEYFLADGAVSEISLDVEIIDGNLHCHLASKHREPCGKESPETAMKHRARRVGGSLRLLNSVSGNHMHLNVPVSAHPPL